MKLIISLFLVSLHHILLAQLQVAKPFSDNMVLQRNKPIVIWGNGLPNAVVQCTLGDEVKETTISDDAKWRIQFSSRELSTKPIDIKVQSGKEVIYFHNILIGDVWLCIGQSNMEWPMRNEKNWNTFSAIPSHDLIRFLNPIPAGRNIYNQTYNDSLLKRLSPDLFYMWDGWQIASKNSLTNMSAVAFFFADAILKKVEVPTGLINLSIGGAPIETFIDEKLLKMSPQFSPKVNGDWRLNNSLPEWIRLRGRQNLDTTLPLFKDDSGPNHAFKPGFAFSSGIYPLKELSITGVLIYQGESNAEESKSVAEYGNLFIMMVNGYRDLWGNKNLPVYWVQLSSIQREYWPSFRDEQRKLIDSIKNGGIVVTSDIGHPTDVHPTDKKTVGERLSRWALHDIYKKHIRVSGPLPLKAIYKKGKVVIYFNHASELKTSDGQEPREFSFDAKNDVRVEIKKNKVIIPSDNAPVYIFYGWKPFSKGNLVNESGLPASTFKLKVN